MFGTWRYRVEWYYPIVKSWIGLGESGGFFFLQSARKRIAREVTEGDNYTGRCWSSRKWRIIRKMDDKVIFEVTIRYRNI